MAPTCAEALSRVLKKKEAKVLYDKTRTLDELPSGVSGSALGPGVNVSHSKIYILHGAFLFLYVILFIYFFKSPLFTLSRESFSVFYL